MNKVVNKILEKQKPALKSRVFAIGFQYFVCNFVCNSFSRSRHLLKHKIKVNQTMQIDSLLFMLKRMTFHTRCLARQSVGLINGFRISPSESYAFIDFCVSFLNKSQIYVFWDELTNSWQLVK